MFQKIMDTNEIATIYWSKMKHRIQLNDDVAWCVSESEIEDNLGFAAGIGNHWMKIKNDSIDEGEE